ncbi:hypothetical protein ACN28C_09245 [Plantactinospora sp. WMMC1484]|uniref:hypothetical protein n=1 Tax=Plantactinospora sp. WMMC1484 TaxID=3404122 RepID=UPI003BF4E50F
MLYDFIYTFSAKDRTGQAIFEANFALNLVFRLGQPDELSADELNAFGSLGVVEIAHPYVRELVHNLTFRMGLPAFIIDVAPPIVGRKGKS